MASQSTLFKPLKIGSKTLSNRLVMAPLTRYRAGDDHVPLDIVKEYYAQRACVPGTLIITEATFISPPAGGVKNIPGIWNDAQIAAWKDIVSAVHDKGGVIYLQLWARGRTADPEYLKEIGGFDLVGPSDIPMSEDSHKPRPMTEQEIQESISHYAQAAKNAVHGAGFDGVEIHGANGYLIDQFIQDVSNNRTDAWGGSIEKRSKFALEVSKAVVEAVGADKTGIRLSPFSTFQGMKMHDPVPQFTNVLEGLKKLKLAYVHMVESRIAGNADKESTDKIDFAVDVWGDTSPVLVAGGFTPASARRAVDEEYEGRSIAIVFGRYFISNPDLVYRIEKDIELVKYDRDTFYTPKTPKGYTDYPFSDQFQQQSRL